MHDNGPVRAAYRRATLIAILVAVLGTTSALAVAAPARGPSGDGALGAKAAQSGGPDYQLPVDRDGDDVNDNADACPLSPGDLRNGCPSELNAEVRGRFQVNRLLTKLVRLTVEAPIGSKIRLVCTGKTLICGSQEITIAKTTHRLTSLTRYFKGTRIYPAQLSILVRVTRSQQIGLYKRFRTRTGRRLPAITQRCLSTVGRVQPCA